MQNELLVFENVSLSYFSKKTETLALCDLSFSVMPEEFISIVGPSGCGKTTLLSLVAGLLQPSSGSVLFLGNKINKKTCCDIGYMFQRDNLLDWRNVEQNVRLGLEIQKKTDKKHIENAKNLIKKYGLAEFEKHYPAQLSGGMRQRVALIRTLATNPKLLLLDEPFSAVDFQTRLIVQDDVANIIKKEKKTALLVTHDISEAVALSSRVLILSKRPAKVKCDLTLDFDKNLTPFERRSDPKFSEYFNKIWEELKNEE